MREGFHVEIGQHHEVPVPSVGECLQVVDDPAHPAKLVHHDRQGRLLVGEAFAEELKVPLADGQRVAQLVARATHEAPLIVAEGFEAIEHHGEGPVQPVGLLLGRHCRRRRERPPPRVPWGGFMSR